MAHQEQSWYKKKNLPKESAEKILELEEIIESLKLRVRSYFRHYPAHDYCCSFTNIVVDDSDVKSFLCNRKVVGSFFPLSRNFVFS